MERERVRVSEREREREPALSTVWVRHLTPTPRGTPRGLDHQPHFAPPEDTHVIHTFPGPGPRSERTGLRISVSRLGARGGQDQELSPHGDSRITPHGAVTDHSRRARCAITCPRATAGGGGVCSTLIVLLLQRGN